MTLRQKTLVIIGVALLGLLVAMYATSRVILLRGLDEAEEQRALPWSRPSQTS